MSGPVRSLEDARARIAHHRGELRAMNVASVRLFGSITRDEVTPESDVDVLVEFDRPVGAFHFLAVQDHLASFLERPVDLVTPRAIKPRMRDRVLGEAVDAG